MPVFALAWYCWYRLFASLASASWRREYSICCRAMSCGVAHALCEGSSIVAVESVAAEWLFGEYAVDASFGERRFAGGGRVKAYGGRVIVYRWYRRSGSSSCLSRTMLCAWPAEGRKKVLLPGCERREGWIPNYDQRPDYILRCHVG